MYTVTRGPVTLLGAAIAGLLIWIATQVSGPSIGDYWGVIGLVAGAGLVLALSQLLGGWTKWGWPRVSLTVFLIGFIPTLIVAGWIILYAQPDANWFQRHFSSWSRDIGVTGFVFDMAQHAAFVLAFGLGLVFGFIFDTTGPRTEPVFRRRAAAAPPPERPTTVGPPPKTEDTAATRVDRPADTAETRVGRRDEG